jgi:hypothetical protein
VKQLQPKNKPMIECHYTGIVDNEGAPPRIAQPGPYPKKQDNDIIYLKLTLMPIMILETKTQEKKRKRRESTGLPNEKVMLKEAGKEKEEMRTMIELYCIGEGRVWKKKVVPQ